MITKNNIIIIGFVSLSIFLHSEGIAVGKILYVNDDVVGANDGTSWDNAYTYLQDALAAAIAGDEIRVAQGVYRPDQGSSQIPGDRKATFRLKNGVKIIGGYAGSRGRNTGVRNIQEYETILSGDLNDDDGMDLINNDENSFHVVTGSDIDITAILDGITITAGNANREYPENCGGGMYNESSNPTLASCTFRNNSASFDGGGMENVLSSPTLMDCTFSNNLAVHHGGGMDNYFSVPNLRDCTFVENQAECCGGGMYSYLSGDDLAWIVLDNCVFQQNSATNHGGGMVLEESIANITNCKFDGNSAEYGGGMSNNSSNPTLADCTFKSNWAAHYGGGIDNWESAPEHSNCLFVDNSAELDGGGMSNWSSNPTLANCTFSNNIAGHHGGGMDNYIAVPDLRDCTFVGNQAECCGGGMNSYQSGDDLAWIVLENCVFQQNSANNGGGMKNNESNPKLNNCIFRNNLAENHGGGVHNYEAVPELRYCTFVKNQAECCGGGLYNYDSNSIVTDCNFTSNTSMGRGGGVKNSSSSPVISRCTFNSNLTHGGSGAGIQSYKSSPTITYCMFFGNISSFNGGGVADSISESALINCVFSGNHAKQAGGGISSSNESTTTLANCTLNRNTSQEKWAGGIDVWNSSTIRMSNSILRKNQPEEIYNSTESTVLVVYCNIQSHWPGIGNIDEDPLFIDDDGLDNIVGTIDDNLRLLAGSPCIDAGSNINVPGEHIDLNGDGILEAHIPWDLDKNPRFTDDPYSADVGSYSPAQGTAMVDIGAYEGSQGEFSLEVNVSSIRIHEGGTAEFAVTLSAPPKEPVEVLVAWQSGDPDISVESSTVLIFDASNYTDPQFVQLQSQEDADYLPGTTVIAVTIAGQMSKKVTVTESDDEPAPRTLFVDCQARGSGDGASWDNAFTDLQPALEIARLIPGMVEVYIAVGTYTPSVETDIGDPRSATFKLNPGMALFGGFAGSTKPDPDERDIDLYKTILSGNLQEDNPNEDVNSLMDDAYYEVDANSLADNAYHVVDAGDTDATTILDGFTIKGGNADRLSNFHHRGGGITILKGSPIIRNCQLENNTALRGGGIYCWEGAPTLINCAFNENSVISDGDDSYGGGIYFDDCNAILIDCAFVNNMAINVENINDVRFYGGGAYFIEGNLFLTNCRFMGNVSSYIGGGMRCLNSKLSAVNCLFSGNEAKYGAAIYTTTTISTFTNCTISRNTANVTGGAIRNQHVNNQVLTNCILWGNTPDEITYYETPEMPAILSYCVIQGGWTDIREQMGNLNVDPRFVDPNGPDGIAGTLDDDLRLLPGSPCIDAGNNMADTDADDISAPGIQPLPGIDLDFYVRWFDDPHTEDTGYGTEPIVDIGAHEFGSKEISPVLYVDNKAGEGKNNGTNWQDAFLDLQTALRTAFVAGDRIHEIWVASGTYTPTPPGGSRDASLNLVDGVGLYGGFAGDEIYWEERDPNSNLTILSGDLQGDDGLDPANNCENSYHVVRAVGVGPATVLDGFIIEGGNADANDTVDGKGGGLYIESASPEISTCIFWDNTAADHGGAIYASFSVPTFFDLMITDNRPEGIWMEYGQARIEGAMKIFSDVLGGHDLTLAGQGIIQLSWNGHLNINDTRIQCDIKGPGVIEVDAGHELVIESDAIIELGNGPWGEIGQIWCNGLLHLREKARLYDADIYVSRASFEDEVIIDNCVIAAEAGGSYGQFFIEDQVKISLPAIIADGDRYLDLDPSQEYDMEKIQVDIIDVNITEGTEGTYGGLFELRGKPPGSAHSGTKHPNNEFLWVGADIPSFDLDTWTINKLELTPGAKLNLTNRFDFQFRHGIDSASEVLYVRELILHEDAILNTAFNAVYCENIIMESGARMLNIPILGFSLNNITCDDASDYSTRITDNNFRDPRNPKYSRTHVERIPNLVPDPDGMMRMRNLMELDPSSSKYEQVISARAKGLFSKSNEDLILVMFEYLFETDEPGTYLDVYLSDKPELVPIDPCSPEWVDHHVYVGSVHPPRRGRPGSVDSSRFGTFHVYANPGDLNFIKGTRVELELIGPEGASVLINDFDPEIKDCGKDQCMNLNGDSGITSHDLIPFIANYGNSSGSNNACLDALLSADGYTDSHDVITSEWAISNPEDLRRNLCGVSIPLSHSDTTVSSSTFPEQSLTLLSASSLPSLGPVPDGLIILGKPQYERGSFFTEKLYYLDDSNPVPLSRSNIKLVEGLDGDLYQINIQDGVNRIKPNDGQRTSLIKPGLVQSDFPETRYGDLADIYVGLQIEGPTMYGRPVWDVVVTEDFVYVVPVVVVPDANASYVAAAMFSLDDESGQIGDLCHLYDDTEYFDVNTPDNPQLDCLHEIELDDLHNVYVLNTQSHNSSQVLWKYNPNGVLLNRLELTNSDIATDPNVLHPVGLTVVNDTVYLGSGHNAGDQSYSEVYAYDTADFHFKGRFTINDMAVVTDMTVDDSNNLCVVGVNVAYKWLDSKDSWSDITGSFYEPCIALISANELALLTSEEVIVQAGAITGDNDLGLPLSIVWTGEN